MSLENDPQWQAYVNDFRTGCLPKIQDSDVCVQIYVGDGTDFDVKQATELGAMLLLDKPIVLVGLPGAILPTRLVRAADLVVADCDIRKPDDSARLRHVITEFVEANRAQAS